MQTLTLQLYNQGNWLDAAQILFSDSALHAPVELVYLNEYLCESPDYDRCDNWACSVNAPVSAIPSEFPHWPALLDDLLPAGKSRQWWLTYLDAKNASEFQQNYQLLTHACISPVGNIRIKEAFEKVNTRENLRFSVQDVASLQYNFLEYAHEQDQAVGGATGAGGVAPKLLVMVAGDDVHIDADFAGKPLQAAPYLTKFARNTGTQRDNNILRAEGVYYRALAQLLDGTGIETIDVTQMMTHEHGQQASLWLPRFDISAHNGIAHRKGMESVYSIINAGAGSRQEHFSVMARVWRKIAGTTSMSQYEFIKQYITRDFLNLVFGNSDNHGRNMSFLKHNGDIQFAPIYDFAPMKADPEMITRVFRWGNRCERSGEVQFDKVIACITQSAMNHGVGSGTHSDPGTNSDSNSDMIIADGSWDPEALMQFLSHLAQRLITLPELLQSLECPAEILDFPAIGFAQTEAKLQRMGVLRG